MPIQLTNDNYYSAAANIDYMSVSQFKDFAGTMAHSSCEATAMARLTGQLMPSTSTALLVGSYVDSYFEGTLDEFKTNHPEIFKKTGDKGLLKEYVQAENIIDRINRDAQFSAYMSGQKQVIMTANLFGINWKIKMDSYHPNDKIVDLKVMRDMLPLYAPSLGHRVSFINYWGYDIQGAIYQKVVELVTGKKLPFYICCATKEDAPDIEIINIDQPYLDEALNFVEANLPRVLNIKNHITEPSRCGTCAFCKATKTISEPITLTDLMRKQNIFINNDDNDTNAADKPNTPIGLFDD